MTKFKKSIKGYDRQEVDAYLHKITEYHESKVRELEECITRLKEENDYLYTKNSEYHRNEERVSDAILKAMQVKDKLEAELRKKIVLEEDRLRIFKSKWTAYAKGLRHADPERVTEDVEEYIRTFRNEFRKRSSIDLDLEEDKPISCAEQSYESERKRLERIRASKDEKMSAASILDRKEEADAQKIGFIED